MSNKKTEYELNKFFDEQIVQSIIENLAYSFFVKDTNGKYLFINKIGAALLNSTQEDIIGKNDQELFSLELNDRFYKSDLRVIKEGKPTEAIEYNFVQSLNQFRYFLVQKTPLFNQKKELFGILGTAKDVTLLIEDKTLVKESEQKFRDLVEKSNVGVFILTHNKFNYINPVLIDIFDCDLSDIIGRLGLEDFAIPEDKPIIIKQLADCSTDKDLDCVIRINSKSREQVHLKIQGTTTLVNNFSAIIGTIEDITEKVHQQQAIKHQAYYDQLTLLPNRVLFYEKLKSTITQAEKEHSKFSILFLDVDGFKHINDTLGHSIGDLLLVIIAKRLKNLLRETDMVARMGGDEFTIILDGLTDPVDLEKLMNNILTGLAEPYVIEYEIIYITVSIGVSIYPDFGDNIDELVKRSDQAMYVAKQQGRNRYCFYTNNMQVKLKHRMRLIKDLRQCIKDEQLSIEYQPIINLKTKKILKAEALIRWRHPELGFISPDEFIPIAEDSGLISRITDFVFAQSIQQVKLWREAIDPSFQISINTSAIDWNEEKIDPIYWLSKIKENGLSPDAINLELTERVIIKSSDEVLARMQAFKDQGVPISLDDFGTGYSSFSYLIKLNIDYIKIDRYFVDQLEERSEYLALIEAVSVMAKALNMKVVAEGIETKKQFELLTSVGCDFGQGYYFSRPVSANQFSELTIANNQK